MCIVCIPIEMMKAHLELYIDILYFFHHDIVINFEMQDVYE